MKRRSALRAVAALGLAVALAACGTSGGGSAPGSAEPAEPQVTLEVSSDIIGLVDTFGKTSAKSQVIFSSGPGDQTLRYYDESGARVAFDDQDSFHENPGVSYVGSATLTIEGAEDDKIDSSAAVVRMADTSMSRADDYILSDVASALTGEWQDGSYTYTLQTGDIELNQYGVGDVFTNPTTGANNSGFEWSTMGGDGNGVYYLALEVSGITYDGVELPAQTFPVTVFCYGRDNSGIADLTQAYEPMAVDEAHTAGLTPGADVQWTLASENEAAQAEGKAYLNDALVDYVSITWPEGTDASAVTAADVTVTLADAYGQTRVLEEETAYGEREYAVIAGESETVVAVTYEQWSLFPAYSSMTVSVSAGDLQAEQTFDAASVSGNAMAQTGGGEQDGVAYTTMRIYNGVEGWAIGDGVDVTYTLSYEDGGTTYYYDGEKLVDAATLPTTERVQPWNGEIVVEPDLASVTLSIPSEDADEYGILAYHNIAVAGGHAYSQGSSLAPMVVDVDVDGEVIPMTVSVSVSVDPAGHLLPGYNLEQSKSQWAYPERFQSGWFQDFSPKPEGLPYVDAYHGYAPEEGSNPAFGAALEASLAAAAEGGPAGGPGAGGPGAGGPGGK